MLKSKGASLEAIAEVYRQQFGRLLHGATAITGSAETGADAVQDAFASAIRHRTSFRAEAPLEAWLWRLERHDDLATSTSPAWVEPALAGFATRYRQALASGAARVVAAAAVNGRRAKRIRFTQLKAGAVEDVLVDAETYAP